MSNAVVIEKAPDNFSAYAHHLPSYIVADTLAEVEVLIQEAIENHLDVMRKYGDLTPGPQAEVQFVEL